MREILGITGDIHSGKTTFAESMYRINPEKHAHYETGTYVMKIGDAFNAAYREHTDGDYIERVNKTFVDLDFNNLFAASIIDTGKLGFDEAAINANPDHYTELVVYLQTVADNPTLLDQPIATGDKSQYRPLLQWLGNHFVTNIHPHVWYKEIFDDVKKNDQDKELILVGGIRYPKDAIFVRSNGTGTPGRIIEIERPGLISDHTSPTEIQRREIKADVRFINNGTVAELGELCLRFYHDLERGHLKPAYRTISPLKKAA